MTVAVEVSEVDYVGNGATTAFPVPFPFTNNNQIIATLTLDGETVALTLTEGTHYTLAGSFTPSGTLTMLTAPAVDSTLHIERTVPIIQATAFRTQGSFSPATHENALDYRTFVDQQLDRRLSAVEAVATAIPASTYDASIIQDQFTTLDPVTDTFPRTIPMGTINPTGVSVVRARNITDGTANFPEGVFVSWQVAPDFGSIPATYDLIINNVSGLEPLKEYVLDLEILTVTPS